MKNLATILPLKSKLPGKFQHFIAIDRTGPILDIGVMSSFLVISNENIFSKLKTLDWVR